MSMRFQSKTPALLVPLLAVMAFAGLSAMAHDLRGQRQHRLERGGAAARRVQRHDLGGHSRQMGGRPPLGKRGIAARVPRA